MSTKYLGDEFDIHGGGLDLIFPHHECEIAQAEGAGKAFARVWMHWNMLTLEGEKMAKSKGHFVTLAHLFAEFDPIVVRFHLLRSHYRSVSEFSNEALHGSAQGLKRLREAHRLLREHGGAGPGEQDALDEYRQAFTKAMEDDLNTPQAVAARGSRPLRPPPSRSTRAGRCCCWSPWSRCSPGR
jgi:cysteinyl-tRNA synthetase